MKLKSKKPLTKIKVKKDKDYLLIVSIVQSGTDLKDAITRFNIGIGEVIDEEDFEVLTGTQIVTKT